MRRSAAERTTKIRSRRNPGNDAGTLRQKPCRTGMDSAITQKGDLESLPLCELSCQDSNLERQNQNLLCYHYTTAQSVARERDKDKQKIAIYNRKTEKCPTLAGVQERISLLLHAWSRQAGQRAGRRPAETKTKNTIRYDPDNDPALRGGLRLHRAGAQS